jgi:hypothetical protein
MKITNHKNLRIWLAPSHLQIMYQALMSALIVCMHALARLEGLEHLAFGSLTQVLLTKSI